MSQAIIQAASEPHHTLFAVAALTGVRAGELLALNVSDLDFTNKTISISKSADNNTRIIREPKTKNSTATLPMPSALEAVLRNYLKHHWKPNAPGLLFPNCKGTKPLNRDTLVKYVLKPILKKLGIPAHETRLHAFRHGLATELANASIPLPVLQRQMRHVDVRTTLKIYSHLVSGTPTNIMKKLAQRSIATNVPISTVKDVFGLYKVLLVEPMGFEPTTSSMPSRRAPNCATAPPNLLSLPQDVSMRGPLAAPAGLGVCPCALLDNSENPAHYFDL